jgi:NADPH:quinone reductase-like Zn-dependent oxidoreductase
MKAMAMYASDGPDRFRLESVADPVPAPTEVLVQVVAAGINPVEWGASAGGWLAALHGGLPMRLGWDGCGRVVEVGYGVTHLRPGDNVFGLPLFPRPAGTYAEFVAAPSRQFVAKPLNISPLQAAALPLAGLTAWRALVDVADLRPGERVLITAAAGGVGHLAVQIAKHRGADVVATARSTNHPFLQMIGADRFIDYTTDDPARFGAFDVIIDLVRRPAMTPLAGLLDPAGRLVSVATAVTPDAQATATARGGRAYELLVEPDLTGLTGIAELATLGKLTVEVARVFPLEQVAAAHDLGR